MQANSTSTRSSVIRILVIGLVLVALYFVQKWVFGSNGLEGVQVLNTIKDANPASAYSVAANDLPALIEGGEYSFNTWFYINDQAVNRGHNKTLFTLGGKGFKTMAAYFGPYRNSLHIRVDTRTNRRDALSADSTEQDLTTESLNNLLSKPQLDTSILNTISPCDIASVDLQKWVQLTVCVNNKVCDVYIDGKLARSCILPSFFKVDPSNIELQMCSFGGFGGFIGNTTAYNYSLNPDQVWGLQMSGPGQRLSAWEWIQALFNPSSASPLDQPKKNMIG